MLRFAAAPRSRGRAIAWSLLLATAAAFGLTRWIKASDHRDSALLTADPAADIADMYTFRSPVHPDNIVLVMTVNGFIPPSEASTTFFDPNVLYQWHIDTDGDAVEDLTIQAFATGTGADQEMQFRVVDGRTHRARDDDEKGDDDEDRGPDRLRSIPTVRVTTGTTPIIAASHGITTFAGVRDDPFFFDLVQFKKIIAGEATGFRNPGIDTFAGTNVLAIVMEFPSRLLGARKVGVWGTTSRRRV